MSRGILQRRLFSLSQSVTSRLMSTHRFSHRDPTTIRSSFMSTIHPKTGSASQRYPVTQEQCGLSRGHPAVTILPLPRTISLSEFGDGLLNTHGNFPIS